MSRRKQIYKGSVKYSGYLRMENRTVCYLGNSDNNHRSGVVIIIDKKSSKAVTNFITLSDQVMMVQLSTKYGILNLIQVYYNTL